MNAIPRRRDFRIVIAAIVMLGALGAGCATDPGIARLDPATGPQTVCVRGTASRIPDRQGVDAICRRNVAIADVT